MFDQERYLTSRGIDPEVAHTASFLLGDYLRLSALNNSYNAENKDFNLPNIKIRPDGFAAKFIPYGDEKFSLPGKNCELPKCLEVITMIDGVVTVGICYGEGVNSKGTVDYDICYIKIPPTGVSECSVYSPGSVNEYLDAYLDTGMSQEDIDGFFVRLLLSENEFDKNFINPDIKKPFKPYVYGGLSERDSDLYHISGSLNDPFSLLLKYVGDIEMTDDEVTNDKVR